MSAFPSVGSTVTRVVTNKSGTTAKVEFDDGTNLLVRYEALVVDTGDSDPIITQAPVRKESKVLMSGGMDPSKIKARQRIAEMKSRQRTQPQHAQPQILDESAYKALAQKALARQQSRQDKIFKQWEHDTGQFDHAAGPVK